MRNGPKNTAGGFPGPRLSEPRLPVLRFSLRYMFWCVTGLCVLLAALVAMPMGMAVVALLLAVSTIVLHVLSTAIGHRLREHANERQVWEANQSGKRTPWGPTPPASMAVQRRSPLHGHEQPLRRMRVCLTAGAILGGLLGVVVLSITIGDRTTVAGIVVGAASTAVVGAWVAFVGASAWSIFRAGWRDAVAEERRE